MIYSNYTRGRSLIVLESQHICPNIVLESQHICPDNSASAVPRVRKKKREEDTGGGRKGDNHHQQQQHQNETSIKTNTPLSKLTQTSKAADE